jgi:hypothetical protein
MTVDEVCVMVSLFMVFLVITGGSIMYDEFRNLENYRRSLNFLVKETTPQGNSQYEVSLKAAALDLLSKNAKRVSNGTATHLQGQKNHRSICIEYFTFGDYREKLMSTFETLVQQQQQEQ